MALPTLMLDMTGTVDQADAQRISYNSLTNTTIPSALQPYIIAVTATPASVVTAPKGSLAINISATTTTSRLYVNTDGGTTWATFTTSA
jgi:hypothetical protein